MRGSGMFCRLGQVKSRSLLGPKADGPMENSRGFTKRDGRRHRWVGRFCGQKRRRLLAPRWRWMGFVDFLVGRRPAPECKKRAVPPGLASFLPLFPALKRWAKDRSPLRGLNHLTWLLGAFHMHL